MEKKQSFDSKEKYSYPISISWIEELQVQMLFSFSKTKIKVTF